MHNTQKRTSQKDRTKRSDQPPKSRAKKGDYAFAIEFGARLRQAAGQCTTRTVTGTVARRSKTAPGAQRDADGVPYRLAKVLGIGNGAAGEYCNGVKLPGARKLRALSDALGVSVDWLLSGEGEMMRAGRRPVHQWRDDFASEVKRRLLERLHAPHQGAAPVFGGSVRPDATRQEREDAKAIDAANAYLEAASSEAFAAIEPQHLSVDANALLYRVVLDAEARFRADYDRRLANANRARVGAEQVQVIDALVKALPVGAKGKRDARGAVRVLERDYTVATATLAGVDSPIVLTRKGEVVALRQWEVPEASQASRLLRRLAERLATS